MSILQDVYGEISAVKIHKTCCVKAFLCGLLYGAEKNADKSYIAALYREADARLAADLIDSGFSPREPVEVKKGARGGHRVYTVSFGSRALCSVFASIDARRTQTLIEAVGFRCADCVSAFLRGVFLSSATLSIPKNGYNLELSVLNEPRAQRLSEMLERAVSKPSITRRGQRFGIYYKSNEKISDLLYFIGAPHASFELQNFGINREIRNTENRATNCVTHNIMRTVDANKRTIDAIQKILSREDAEALLSEELMYTARLRIEYDAASLSELASYHEPPLTKSGLNTRLRKIITVADSLEK